MNKSCMKWRDQLLETALGKAMENEMESHLAQCPDCAAELNSLRARRKRLDGLLPLIATAEEPSPGLSARIMSDAKAKARPQRVIAWRRWELAAATVLLVAALVIGWALNRRQNKFDSEIRKAQELAQWRAPTDVLLQVPGQEFLHAVPKLGDSYLTITAGTEKGEK